MKLSFLDEWTWGDRERKPGVPIKGLGEGFGGRGDFGPKFTKGGGEEVKVRTFYRPMLATTREKNRGTKDCVGVPRHSAPAKDHGGLGKAPK